MALYKFPFPRELSIVFQKLPYNAQTLVGYVPNMSKPFHLEKITHTKLLFSYESQTSINHSEFLQNSLHHTNTLHDPQHMQYDIALVKDMYCSQLLTIDSILYIFIIFNYV